MLIAIRENERAASAFGVNARATTLGAFAISGFLAAFAGALFVHQQNGLQLDSYTAGESLVVFTMVVIGGLGSVPGALLGALFVRGVTWWLPVEWQILATGAGMLVVLLVFRGGLGAAFADLRDRFLRRVARRRGLAVPALTGVTPGVVRDDAAPPSPAAPVTDGRPAALRVRELDVELRRRAGAVRRRPRRRCGRDRRAARHQRLGEVDAARRGVGAARRPTGARW